ncbi:hypothetical protein J6590_095296 [Homalodisca vitripennis]|nr:hypothetical protein J6590_095296 [Homalodisca vitripennis]
MYPPACSIRAESGRYLTHFYPRPVAYEPRVVGTTDPFLSPRPVAYEPRVVGTTDPFLSPRPVAYEPRVVGTTDPFISIPPACSIRAGIGLRPRGGKSTSESIDTVAEESETIGSDTVVAGGPTGSGPGQGSMRSRSIVSLRQVVVLVDFEASAGEAGQSPEDECTEDWTRD